jgi:hypothetical protein
VHIPTARSTLSGKVKLRHGDGGAAGGGFRPSLLSPRHVPSASPRPRSCWARTRRAATPLVG